MKNKVTFFILFFILFPFLYSEEVFFIKRGNSFLFFKIGEKQIEVQKSSGEKFETFIDEDISGNSYFKIFKSLNSKIFLYVKRGNLIKIFRLNEDIWKKVGEITLDEMSFGTLKTKKEKVFHFFKKIKNTISNGKIVYLLSENFDSFYLGKEVLYTLKIDGNFYIVKMFKIEDVFPQPPLNVTQAWEHNYSLYSEEYLNEIKWSRNSLNSGVQNYNIYRKLKSEPYSKLEKIAHVAENVYFYWDRGLKSEEKDMYVYGVSVVDVTLVESKIATTDGKYITPAEGPLCQWIFKIN